MALQTLLSTICLLVLFRTAKSVYLTPCIAGDQACMNKTANDVYQKFMVGIPELGIEPHEPIMHPLIEGEFAMLKFKFFNSTISGMDKCTISDVNANRDALTAHLLLTCPKIVLQAIYEINGTLIAVPVHGEGDCSITTGKYKIAVDLTAKIVEGSDGKRLSIKTCKVDTDPVEPIKFEAGNLFNGDKQLSDMVHDFAHANYKDVNEYIETSVWNVHCKKLMSTTNKFFKAVPLNEIMSK